MYMCGGASGVRAEACLADDLFSSVLFRRCCALLLPRYFFLYEWLDSTDQKEPWVLLCTEELTVEDALSSYRHGVRGEQLAARQGNKDWAS